MTTTNVAAGAQAGPELHADAVRSRNSTFQVNGTTGARSVSELDAATIGDGRLGISIRNLRGLSTAFAQSTGELDARSSFTFSSIRVTGSDAGLLPADVQNLLNGPVNQVVNRLRTGQPIEVPGLGELTIGDRQDEVTSSYATSGSTGLNVTLYGVDGQRGGGDDSVVTLGSTMARISNASPDGLLVGQAYGLDAVAADGHVVVGPDVRKSLPCEGTDGRILTNAVTQLSPPALDGLALAGLQNRVYGAQIAGGVTGWTEHRIASLDLGSRLHVDAVVVRSTVTRHADGTLERHVIRRVGAITANGTRYSAPAPGQFLDIPDVARIETPRSVSTATGVSATGLRITLLSGSAAQTVVNIAVTRAASPE